MTLTDDIHCSLKSLPSHVLKGLAPGIVIKDQKPVLDAKRFTCCYGTGMYESVVKENTICYCSLKERLKLLDELVSQFYRRWPKATLALDINLKNEARFLKWCTDLNNGLPLKGYYLIRKSLKPSSLWPFAVMALWRFGIPIIWISLEQDSLPKLAKIFATTEKRAICFVEIQGAVWKYADVLDYVVTACENADFPLWLDILEDAALEIKDENTKKQEQLLTPAQQKFYAALQNTLHRARSKNPIEQLNVASRSRIRSTTNIN